MERWGGAEGESKNERQGEGGLHVQKTKMNNVLCCNYRKKTWSKQKIYEKKIANNNTG